MAYVLSHLHFRKLLKNQVQPAEVVCLLLELSTQTRV